MNKFIRIISTAMGILFVSLLFTYQSYSQIPKGIPKPTGPIDFSKTSNVIIFGAIPAIILIVYLVFRKRIKKIKQEKREKLKKRNENE
ncbi:hypothetical protein [Algoriphagus halophilus]|uniref:Uncharacterized protein n=1 Tax=Algoriphagus halophilus TaxID=226505 RepID=A0A1N6DYH5_9BACT|nr:hypothetical protein [Algoriphagus halophilus]SIN75829.1 hypothetical protein SAMN05444394_1533 [Algoriphagus halophilus]